MIHAKFYKLFYKQKTCIQNVRKNCGCILYQRYKLFIRRNYLRYKITRKVEKKGGEFHTEFTSYCYKDIRGIKLQGKVSKGNH